LLSFAQDWSSLDNLSKFVFFDACNETFYGDDGQVVSVTADKCYDDSNGGAGFISLTIESIQRIESSVARCCVTGRQSNIRCLSLLMGCQVIYVLLARIQYK
jgi:hypothetical protein